jgi:hypothetical protein
MHEKCVILTRLNASILAHVHSRTEPHLYYLRFTQHWSALFTLTCWLEACIPGHATVKAALVGNNAKKIKLKKIHAHKTLFQVFQNQRRHLFGLGFLIRTP